MGKYSIMMETKYPKNEFNPKVTEDKQIAVLRRPLETQTSKQ